MWLSTSIHAHVCNFYPPAIDRLRAALPTSTRVRLTMIAAREDSSKDVLLAAMDATAAVGMHVRLLPDGSMAIMLP